MAKLIFITHPEVVIDPAVPVPRWQLSDAGVARMRVFTASSVVENVTAVWASTETKAIEGAGILAARLGVGVSVDEALGENDRSATGYLPGPEFEAMADAFFGSPEESVRGWERAIDAQSRVSEAVRRIVVGHGEGDLAIVAHGAVGALLMCLLRGQPISRAADQPFAGHYWVAELPDMAMVGGWHPIAPRARSDVAG
ncbi:MAG: histidine phosphatase family protein [Cereibacter sphaeroides]|uniref:Histidine phosphatase family protein n=1 Tax=Cereibacter sphaeroides TaxID=1063 RepID=A0A2W5SFY8_CERSP|nr:MAG: histidine phosphatase family protein [Cereibacter sphaeroides]